MQRTESMMALCYLTTLYASIRAKRASRALGLADCRRRGVRRRHGVEGIDGRPRRCVVLVYDRVFLYPSLGAACASGGRCTSASPRRGRSWRR